MKNSQMFCSLVKNWKELNEEVDGCGGVIYNVIDIKNSGLQKVELALCIFAPGVTANLHHHEVTEEIYFIIEGEGEVELNGVWHKLTPEDSVALPVQTCHRMRNTSDTKPLKFLAVNAPFWRAEDLIND